MSARELPPGARMLEVELPAVSPAPAAARSSRLFQAIAANGIFAGLFAGGIVSGLVLFGFGGWTYFTTPLRARGYVPVHRLLRPSGPYGQLLGVAGSVLMLLTILYVVRKRVKRFARVGSAKNWLEFHIFCGIFGPVLISLHTSFKFNGIVSVAYWSMVLVVLSGFVGRVLYARIPRTIRGEELSHAELVARAEELERELLDRDARPELVDEARRIAAERATLTRRIANLQRTKRLFGMWHDFHLPLVWILFVIFVLHIAVVTYLGYTFLSR
jgi:hypothetical protein